jgi:hypothetical protein
MYVYVGNTPTQLVDPNGLGKGYSSSRLARNRFKFGGGKRGKGIGFRRWKRGREAQHLIPGAIGVKFKLTHVFLDSSDNGIMLISGRSTKHGRKKPHRSVKKSKLKHVKGGGCHPNYSKSVEKFINNVNNNNLTLSINLARKVSKTLRHVTKSPPSGVKYVDQLTVSDFLNTWKSLFGQTTWMRVGGRLVRN